MFPVTETDFAKLKNEGKGIEIAETNNPATRPEGKDWIYLNDRTTPDEQVSVWWRIVTQ